MEKSLNAKGTLSQCNFQWPLKNYQGLVCCLLLCTPTRDQPPQEQNVSLYTYHYSIWLTSHPRSTVVLLDTGTPGTSREIFSEDADGETQTRNPSVINPVL